MHYVHGLGMGWQQLTISLIKRLLVSCEGRGYWKRAVDVFSAGETRGNWEFSRRR